MSRACSARLGDGRELERVIVTDCRALDRRPRIGDFGYAIWPSSVASLPPSPLALPLPLVAEATSAAGETAMGLRVFGVTLRDGRRYRFGGNHLAFPPLPPGATGADVASIRLLTRIELETWAPAPNEPRVWICEHL